MALTTLAELRSNIGSTVRETQVNDLITSYINLTLLEVWQYHPWTWARRKQTLSTVASQEDYTLDEEIDRLVIIRQRSTPTKLQYLPDQLFYRMLPNPEDLGTGIPLYYRLFEETGFSAQPTSAEKITVQSSSTADTSSFSVRVVGRNSTVGLRVAETITLNGTTPVASTNTYAVSGLLQVSKSAATTGYITIKGNTSASTFGYISPEDTTPRYKKISFYPIPSSAITLYLEYIERPRLLVADTDVPMMDAKWIYALREGALAKMWEYKQNEALALQHLTMFRQQLDLLKRQDGVNLDFIPVIEPRFTSSSIVRRVKDSVSNAFPSYYLVP